ncbi:unnamed protein product [Blepharisma stoltei]|uniref:Uncharacterized protein n=1 Tax=Blepharisma stoltei TaxID=1481888 RepID=A0AAU9ISE7_9CILI|nr:unnamed protein product [Blepharisma stoltei]
MSRHEKNAAVLDAFQRFLQIQESTQSRFNGFVQNFNSQMTTFFKEQLLPLTITKIASPKLKPCKIPEKKSDPVLPMKRPKEALNPVKTPIKNAEVQLSNHVETMKAHIRELYAKNINPALISKLFNLKLDLIHSIGDYSQCPEDEKTQKLELKSECLKLRDSGTPVKYISKSLKLPKKKIMTILGEISPCDLLKSSESKKVIVSKIKEGVPKVALAKDLGMPIYKLQNWIDKVEKGEEPSDNDAIHSEGDYGRDTIRNSLFSYYQTDNFDVSAEMCNVYARDIENWIEKFEENTEGPRKRHKKTVKSSAELIDNHQSLLAEFLKKASTSSIQSNSTEDQEEENCEAEQESEKPVSLITQSILESEKSAQNECIDIEPNDEEGSERTESESSE